MGSVFWFIDKDQSGTLTLKEFVATMQGIVGCGGGSNLNDLLNYAKWFVYGLSDLQYLRAIIESWRSYATKTRTAKADLQCWFNKEQKRLALLETLQDENAHHAIRIQKQF